MTRSTRIALVLTAVLTGISLPLLPSAASAASAAPAGVSAPAGSSTTASIHSEHSAAQQATTEIAAMGHAVVARARSAADVAPSLVPASRARRAALLQLAQSDPAGVAELLLPDEVLTAVGSVPGNALEKKVVLRGTYVLQHRDRAQGAATFTPQVITSSGPVSVVYSDGRLPAMRSGDEVAVEAYQLDQQTAIAHAAGSTAPTSSSATTGASTPLGPLGIAVIFANFSNSTASIDPASTRAAFQGRPGSDVASWYAQSSYGRSSLAPSFFGPYTISDTTASGACPNLATAGTRLMAEASSSITYSQYRRIIMIFNCTGYGASTSVGEGTISTPQGPITGAVTYMDATFLGDRYGFAHELAHNLGNLHAAFFNCQPASFVPPSRFGDDNCSSTEYGDEFDTLGATLSSPRALPHLGVHHTRNAGWFGPGNNVSLSTPGTYSYKLLPYETPTSDVLALTIPRGSSGTAFTLEYRQAIGFDAWMAPTNTTFCGGKCTATKGPLLRLVHSQSGSGGGSDTQAIDTTPNSITSSSFAPVEDNRDGALLPGRTFTDPEYGISVTTQSADATGATVLVTIPTTATCTRAAPNVALLSPSEQPAPPGQPLTYTFRITSNDATSCGSEDYRYVGGPLTAYNGNGMSAQFTAVASPDRFALVPGEVRDVAVTLRPETTVLAGTYSFASTPSRSIGWIQTDSLNVADVPLPDVGFQVTSPPDTVPPTVPSGMTAEVLGSAAASLSWAPSTDNAGVAGYRVVVDNAALYVVAQPSFVARQLRAGTTPVISVQAFDRQGNLSAPTTINVALPAKTDTTPPVAPSEPVVSVTDRSVTATWSPSSDNVRVIGYVVSPFNTWVPAGSTSATFADLPTRGRYDVRVQAVDGAGNLSPAAASSVSLTTARAGTVAPTRPMGLLSPVATVTGGISLTWEASSAPAGVAGYYVYRNGRRWASVTSPSYNDPAGNLHATGAGYQYYVEAYDAAGNTSPASSVLQTISPKTTASDTRTPTGAALSSPIDGALVTGTVMLATAPSDDVAVASTEFYVDGRFLGRSTVSPHRFSWVTTSTWNGKHTVYTRAYDTTGNYATASSTTVTVQNGTADTAAPTTPANVTGTAVSADQVNVTWTASTDAVGVTGYTVYRDGVVAGTVTGSSWSDTTVTGSTSHTYAVAAFDAAGNKSPTSATVSVPTPGATDTTAPTAATNLVATAISPTQVNLTWTASTDSTALTYRIYRDGADVGSSAEPGWSDTALRASTAYSYYVVAADAAGNTSPPSATVSATTGTAATTGAIAGTVRRESTGAPVANAKITTSVNGVRKSYYTDPAGSYTITGLPAGSYTLTFTAKGSRSQSVGAAVTAGQTTKVDVSL